ncbi:MAG: DUF2497 domain-containing protein [Pontixanthobacter sp.]
MSRDGESSVEEILESIKKVIARDSRSNTAGERRRNAVGEAPPPESRTEAAAEFQTDPASADEAEEILDLGSDDIVDDDAGPEAFAGEGLASDDMPDSDADDEPLLNASARSAMRDNLAALAMLAEPGTPPQIVRSGETSLEGLTRELMRPMLAEWLDAHLPDMVEKLVRAEISRIAGKRG